LITGNDQRDNGQPEPGCSVLMFQKKRL